MVEKDLSAREKKILASLIKANDYITAAELSKILNVSEKTIYRDLQSIKNKLGVTQSAEDACGVIPRCVLDSS